jgi:glycine dehydrogenase subunit 2
MNAPNASGWKPEMVADDGSVQPMTVSGDKGLQLEEP